MYFAAIINILNCGRKTRRDRFPAGKGSYVQRSYIRGQLKSTFAAAQISRDQRYQLQTELMFSFVLGKNEKMNFVLVLNKNYFAH